MKKFAHYLSEAYATKGFQYEGKIQRGLYRLGYAKQRRLRDRLIGLMLFSYIKEKNTT